MAAAFDIEVGEGSGDRRALVVLVHGYGRRLLRSVPGAVRAALPSADIMTPKYEAGRISSASAVGLADQLSEAIQARCSAFESARGVPYSEIILVGHSMGALLVRKAFVFARGQNHELCVAGLNRAPRPWAHSVSRIVLLAGMNRGWSLRPRPPRMNRAWNLALRAADTAATVVNAARLLRSMRRGSPFVANLRIQWINLVRSGASMPLVVQILGDKDDLVHEEDNIDLQSGRDFVYLQAPAGTTHANVVDLSDPARRDLFLRALLRSDLRSDYTIPPKQMPDKEVEQVIFIMHGIRDFGDWTGRFARAIQAKGAERGRKIVPLRPSYGYFPMLKFLLFPERQKNVRWFMDEYTEALARFPNATIDFVGHSNGTYLLASALRRYAACSFNRAVFAGSVVPRDFPWDELVRDGRIVAIRNYVASADKVVGIFPRLFEPLGDVGSAGLFGFTREPATQLECHYVAGGHGAAINDANFASIAAFLIDGVPSDPPPEIVVDRYDSPTLVLSKLNWAVWILLLAAVGLAAWLVAFRLAPSHVIPWVWLRLVLFFAIVLAILNTI